MNPLYQKPEFVGGTLTGIIIALCLLMLFLSAKEIIGDFMRKRRGV